MVLPLAIGAERTMKSGQLKLAIAGPLFIMGQSFIFLFLFATLKLKLGQLMPLAYVRFIANEQTKQPKEKQAVQLAVHLNTLRLIEMS